MLSWTRWAKQQYSQKLGVWHTQTLPSGIEIMGASVCGREYPHPEECRLYEKVRSRKPPPGPVCADCKREFKKMVEERRSD